MTHLIDMEAFLVTARTGSFSAAAREIGTSTSVITKRVSRLESDIGTPLFVRSTRSLTLTTEGKRMRPRLQVNLAELANTLQGAAPRKRGLTGHLRVKSPTTIGTIYVGQMIARFQARNPGVTNELLLIDRSVNPLEENFDVALGALPASYAGVLDLPLCKYERMVVAAPGYIERAGTPTTPNDLVEHDCLAFLPIGLSWSFESDGGVVVVDIHATFSVNDSRVLTAAAVAGLGITVLPRFLAEPAIGRGELRQVLPDHPLTELWFKAMTPKGKARRPEVRALLDHLKAEFVSFPSERS